VQNRPDFNSPFIEAGIKAYLDWYTLLWTRYSDRKLKATFVGNVADMRKAKDTIKNVESPILLAGIARIELDMNRGAGARRFQQILTGLDRSKGKSNISTLIPVRIGVVTVFRTDKGPEVKSFIEMMLNCYPGTVFYFEDDWGFRIACRVNIEDGQDFPAADIAGPGDMYQLEPVVSFNTYIGTVEERGLIRDIKVKYSAGTGGVATTIYVDEKTNALTELDETKMKYTDPFDKRSSQWKGL
jgi:hypothetical protein